MPRLLRHVKRRRDLARIDPSLARLANRVGNDGSHLRRPWRRLTNERAAALPAVEQAFLVQSLVDGFDRIDVDLRRIRQLAQAGEALARLETSVLDARAQRPGELHADRD